MAQRTIYLPDDLDAAVKAAGINASQVCRDALQAAVTRTSRRPSPWHAPDVRVTDVKPPQHGREIEQTSEPAACVDGTHQGPVRNLGYAKVCDACGRVT